MAVEKIESDKLNTISEALKARLNEHGYCFQYASLEFIRNIIPQLDDSPWIFQASEFPVQVKDKDKGTRIDFVLRSKHSRARKIFLLFECKRSNPALKNWCFLRLPYVRKDRTSEYFFAETVSMPMGSKIKSTGKILSLTKTNGFYHIAIEVKSGEKGNQNGKSFGEIEDASTQICRGLNG